jgi:hypothetical protein
MLLQERWGKRYHEWWALRSSPKLQGAGIDQPWNNYGPSHDYDELITYNDGPSTHDDGAADDGTSYTNDDGSLTANDDGSLTYDDGTNDAESLNEFDDAVTRPLTNDDAATSTYDVSGTTKPSTNDDDASSLGTITDSWSNVVSPRFGSWTNLLIISCLTS